MSKKVEIPDSLYKKIENRLKESNFENMSDYLTYALRDFLDKEINKVNMLLGRADEEKICKECGHRETANFDFCPYCGTEMEKTK